MSNNEENKTNDYFLQIFDYTHEHPFEFVVKSATTTAAIIAGAYIVPSELTELLLFNNEDTETSYYKLIRDTINSFIENFSNLNPNRVLTDEELGLMNCAV